MKFYKKSAIFQTFLCPTLPAERPPESVGEPPCIFNLVPANLRKDTPLAEESRHCVDAADFVAGLPKLGRSHRHFNAPVLIVSVRHWHGWLGQAVRVATADEPPLAPPSAKRPTLSRMFL